MAEARVLEANAFLRRYDALSASLQELDSQAEDCRAQTQDLLARRAQEQAQSAQAEEEVNRLDRHIAQLNESVLELTRQSQMHKGEGDLLEQRLASAASDLERLDGRKPAPTTRRAAWSGCAPKRMRPCRPSATSLPACRPSARPWRPAPGKRNRPCFPWKTRRRPPRAR